LLFSPFTNTTGGVASRTGRPELSGTCSCNLAGLAFSGWKAVADCDGPDDVLINALCSSLPTRVFSDAAWLGFGVGNSEPFGFAGNVENGPFCVVRWFAGRPLTLPVEELDTVGQAEDTAGARRRLFGILSPEAGVIAERGSLGKTASESRNLGVIADCGYCTDGDVSRPGSRQRKS
jgi:hypothetical protein